MSHVIAAKATRFAQDEFFLQAMQAACNELGLVFEPNQTTFQWFGRWMNDYKAEDAAYNRGIPVEMYGRCRHRARLKYSAEEAEKYAQDVTTRPYELGFCEDEAGFLVPVFDNWVGGNRAKELEEVLGGVECQKLVPYYNACKAVLIAQKNGCHVASIQKLPDGGVKVIARKKRVSI